MNSHTVSLNAEEQRHAQYQGDMKWFIYELSREFGPTMESLGVFGLKQMARMQDAKFYADVIYALFNGINTTKKAQLDSLYRDFNSGFDSRDEIKDRFSRALEFIAKLEEIYGTKIIRHYQFYALILAVMHVQNSVNALSEIAGGDNFEMRSEDEVLRRLARLNAALDEDDPPRMDRRFWIASREKTNTGDHRGVRFKAFLNAIASQ